MDEFSLIDTYFKPLSRLSDEVIVGIGDDCACLHVPAGQELLVSTDTLVADVHFESAWDPYDIAYKAIMVNVSDIAAMAGQPCWVSLALTLPEQNKTWLSRFSQGLRDALNRFNLVLIGGDTTRGPLCMTITIHGLAKRGQAIRRSGAKAGDKIYLSGEIGAAALAVAMADLALPDAERAIVMNKLQHPQPRIDLAPLLQGVATAAIDISDGLSADLNHICVASQLGACLFDHSIPIHPLVTQYKGTEALDFALTGGDDYELCFTIPSERESEFVTSLATAGLSCFPIGVMESERGMRIQTSGGAWRTLSPQGYCHF